MEYNLATHISGDTWKGVSGITIYRDGSALDLTGATAVALVKLQIDAPPVLKLSTEDNTIVFIDPVNGVLDFPSMVVDVPPAVYQWSLRISLSSGEVKTFLNGIWHIISNTKK
jgi:hypothetical protein